jgi:hypothetical protein
MFCCMYWVVLVLKDDVGFYELKNFSFVYDFFFILLPLLMAYQGSVMFARHFELLFMLLRNEQICIDFPFRLRLVHTTFDVSVFVNF